MMGSTMEDNGAVQSHIDNHLDRIDAVLQVGGMSRSERRHILDDVQTQIHDMLAERCAATPTVEEVRAVLAELDPPEGYAPENAPPGYRTVQIAPVPEKKPSLVKEVLGRIALMGLIIDMPLVGLAVHLRLSNQDASSGFMISLSALWGPLVSVAALGLLSLPNRYGKAAMIGSLILLVLLRLTIAWFA